MTSPFLTFAEVAAYLRYDLDGPNGAKAKAALVKWLAKYGCRPSLKRGLYRLVQIEAACDRLDAAQTRRRNRGFQSQSARFKQAVGPSKGVGLSPQDVGVRHADSIAEPATTTPYKALGGGCT